MKTPRDVVFREDLPGVKGLLRISTFGQEPVTAAPGTHISVYVNGPDYAGLEDNDLRGFVDGGYCWAWNQASQMHVRVGRSARWIPPRYGENELFRTIQRWKDICLPTDAEVSSARLELIVELESEWPVRLFLYEVRKEWNPGRGGIYENNVSVPKQGEVWWNDASYGEVAWGLPGAGFASRDHQEADTDIMPLADTLYRPGQSSVIFTSKELAEYVTRRIGAKKPVLFLVKASDHLEDIPGSMLSFYSGDYGDSRNTSRRPRLTLEWTSRAEQGRFEEPVLLEHGRTYLCRPQELSGGDRVAVSFWPASGYEAPTVEVRQAVGDSSKWVRIGQLFRVEEELELRVIAAQDPVPLGSLFDAELSDRGVVTGPADQQNVPWVFTSPTGTEHHLLAEYLGGFRWAVRFVPDEIGRWHYHWSHEFIQTPHMSTEGMFDVIPGDLTAIEAELERLVDSLKGKPDLDQSEKRLALLRFLRLQRGAFQRPELASSSERNPSALHRLMHTIRSLLWGQQVPDPLPQKSAPLVRTDSSGGTFEEPIPLLGNHSNRDSSRSRWRIGLRGRRLRKLYTAARRTIQRVTK